MDPESRRAELPKYVRAHQSPVRWPPCLPTSDHSRSTTEMPGALILLAAGMANVEAGAQIVSRCRIWSQRSEGEQVSVRN